MFFDNPVFLSLCSSSIRFAIETFSNLKAQKFNKYTKQEAKVSPNCQKRDFQVSTLQIASVHS